MSAPGASKTTTDKTSSSSKSTPTTPSSKTTPKSTPSTSSTPTSTSTTTTTTPETTSSTTSTTPTTSSTPTSTSTTTSSTPPPSTQVTTVIVTSTAERSTTSSTPITTPSSSDLVSSITSSAATSTSTGGSGGLSAQGTIAIAVVVPVVAVAAIIGALLFWWRKHKSHKLSEEERKQEIEEYQYNPNNDPTLPSVGLMGGGAAGAAAAGAGVGAGAAGGEAMMMRDTGHGYRGWGATSNSRHAGVAGPPTNSSSLDRRGTVSDNGSNTLYGREGSPIEEGMQYPDDELRQGLGRADSTGAVIPMSLQAAAGRNRVVSNGGNNQPGIQRGVSNASSAYSVANGSDISDERQHPGGGAQYYGESAYYEGNQPVIRDVQARRNTHIESPSVFPQQGNAGISQNF